MKERIGFGPYKSSRNREVLDVCLCFGCGGVCGIGGEWVRSLDGWGGVMSV